MNSNNNGFLLDLVRLLREQAEEAREQARIGGDFERGYQLAYYEVLSLIHDQTTAFGIDLKSVGLADFEPESILTMKSE